MDTNGKMRSERIERLLDELRYEILRGCMEREIDESLQYTFIVPVSSQIPDGVVMCEFRTRPAPRSHAGSVGLAETRLRIVGEGGRDEK